MRSKIFVIMALIAAVIMAVGCGASMTVVREIEEPGPEPITPSPSDTSSAALLSGFGVSRGGEHYKIVQSLGGPMAKPVQESASGTYVIKDMSKDQGSKESSEE